MISGLTPKALCEESGAPFYTVKYLHALGRLPVLRESSGRGYPTIFHRDAITIVRQHMARQEGIKADG